MIFIKKAIQKQQGEVSLVKLLDERLAGREIARSHKIVHISMLSKENGFCPREFALLDATSKMPRNEFVSMPQRVAYDTGNALSDLVRNRWLVDDVVGDWRCLGCRTVLEFCKRPSQSCGICQKKNLWVYSEPRFVEPESQAEGNIDFFIDFNHGKHYLVEVKTIDKDEFKDLKAPYAEHRIRTQLYLRAIERSRSVHARKIDTTFGIVLYISKGYGKKTEEHGKITPFREYKVYADRDAADALFARGETLAKYRNGASGMPAGICPNSFCPRAKHCVVVKECWGGKYPAAT